LLPPPLFYPTVNQAHQCDTPFSPLYKPAQTGYNEGYDFVIFLSIILLIIALR